MEAVARRSGLTPAEVISDALEHSHFLEWPERFLDTVAAGIEAADRGEFARKADIDQVANKYRGP
ncbi:MAG: transcriptional regulator [Rhizobiaceae bacterium]|nr:transcriptional regulator [Rhizobiaceae bacterium]